MSRFKRKTIGLKPYLPIVLFVDDDACGDFRFNYDLESDQSFILEGLERIENIRNG